MLSQDELRAIFTKHSNFGSCSDVFPNPTTPDHDSNAPTTSEMTLDAFTAFLLSPDNSVFADQNREIWHDMTRPISEYFISSSHNTYLVGHQLVGDSTIEGYIRALLHSCRSVERQSIFHVHSVDCGPHVLP
jgi:phosphatidylinositol phospholipase C delta